MKKLIGIITCAMLASLCVLAFAGCGIERIHDHVFEKHEAVAATCEATGSIEYYSCSECGKFYKDAEGNEEIAENGWITAATGHDYGDDAVCKNGCESKLDDAAMIERGYIAKADSMYYKTLDAAFEAVGNGTVMLITHMDIAEPSDISGYAYGVLVESGILNGNGKNLEMTFGDSDKFSGLWILGETLGVKSFVIISDTKTAVYAEDMAHEVVLENLDITAEGSGFHIERCAKVILQNNHVVSSNIAGYKAAVFAGHGAQVLIESGHYEAEHAILTGGYKGAGVEVLGGNFVGAITVNGADTLVIKGGTFSVDPSAYVPAGYIALYDSEIQAWVVEKCAEVSTLAEFTKAVSAGGNIRLMANIELTAGVTISKEVLIDLNGYDLTNSMSTTDKLFLVKKDFTIASSVEGSEIALGNAGLMQISSDNPDAVGVISNVTVSRTATSSTELVLHYGPLVIEDVIFNLAGGSMINGVLNGGSICVCNSHADLTLENTVINVSGILGTSIINNNKAKTVTIKDVEMNIERFRTNAGYIISRNKGTLLLINDLALNVGLDESYSSKFINTVEGTDEDGNSLVQLGNISYNVVGLTSGKAYLPNENAKWVAIEGTYAGTAEATNEALAVEGGEVLLSTSLNIETTSASNGYGATGIAMTSGGVLDGNGYTLSVPGANTTWASALSTNGGTVKNLTINAGFKGIFVTANGSKVYLENVVVDGPVYTISCDQASGHGLEAKFCTFNGWTSYAATLGNVKFDGCSFGEGAGYAYCRPYAPTEFVNCNFEEGFVIDARAAITFENCYLNGELITAENLATLVINTANASVK